MSIFLVECRPWDPTTQSEVPINFASGLVDDASLGTSTPYHVRLRNSFEHEISVFQDNLPGKSSISLGSVTINNADGRFDYLLDFAWGGRNVVVKQGEASQAYNSFETLFSGSSIEISATGKDLVLSLRDNSWKLIKPLQQNKFLGTGGREASRDLQGTTKPLCFGLAKNISPVLVDPILNIYQVHDGEIVEVEKVFDDAVPLSYVGPFLSYEDMAEANIPNGGYIDCPTEGFFRLGAPPFGALTADVKGEFYSAFSLAATLEQILLSRSVLTSSDIQASDFVELDADSPARVSGLYFAAPELDITNFLDDVLGSINAFSFFGIDGKLRVRQFKFRTSSHTVEAETIKDLSRQVSAKPVYSVSVLYDKNLTVQNTTGFSLSANSLNSYLEDEILYVQTNEDGTGGDYSSVTGKMKVFLSDTMVNNLSLVDVNEVSDLSWVSVNNQGDLTFSDPGMTPVQVNVRSSVFEESTLETLVLRKIYGPDGPSLRLNATNRILKLSSNNYPINSSENSVITAAGKFALPLNWEAVDNLEKVIPLSGTGSSRTLSISDIQRVDNSMFVRVKVTDSLGQWATIKIIVTHDQSSIADAGRYYEDGTRIDDLQPAEEGATNTANPDSPVGPDGLTVFDVLEARQQAINDISNLFATYGDTSSAAYSASQAAASAALSLANANAADTHRANAALAQSIAETARTQSEYAFTQADAARQASESAKNLSYQEAQNAIAAASAAAISKTAADGSATSSAGHASTASDKASEAGDSAESASASANVATSQAGLSSGSAAAAASSASYAGTKSDEAGQSAAAAQSNRLSAESTAQSLMPSTFQNIGNWTSDFGGGSGSLETDNRFTAVDEATYGRVLAVDNITNFYPHIASKGRIPLIRDHVVRMTVKWQLRGGQDGSPVNASMFAIGLKPDGGQWNNVNQPVDIAAVVPGWGSGWATHIMEIHTNTLMDQGCAWVRPLFRIDSKGYYYVQSVEARDITGEWNAYISAGAAATSASQAGTHADNAGSSAYSATQSANTATAQAGLAAGSAGAASTHASNAASSASGASNSAAASQNSQVSATSAAATTMPSGFSPTEQRFWIADEGNPDVANAGGYGGDWFGPVEYPVFVTRANESSGLATRATFVPTIGRKYKVTLYLGKVADITNGLPASFHLGFIRRDGSGINYDTTNFNLAPQPLGHWWTLTHEWVCQQAFDWCRARVHWNDGLSNGAWHIRTFKFEDITESTAAQTSASAAAGHASTAASYRDQAGSSASSANTSATNANSSYQGALYEAGVAAARASDANYWSGQASTSAGQASSSASNAAGSANSAGTYATNAANSANASGQSANAASGSASTAATKASEAGLFADSALSSLVSARSTTAMSLPSGFSPNERQFWISEEGNADIVAPGSYNGDWFGGADYPVYATRANESGVLASRGVFVPKNGRRYRSTMEISRVTNATNGRPSRMYIGFIARNSGGSNEFQCADYDGHALIGGQWQNITHDWVVNGIYAWARPRLHWNSGGDGGVGADVAYHIRKFLVEDITSQTEAAGSASAAASSASTAGIKATEAGQSASSANTSATNANTSHQGAQYEAGVAAARAGDANYWAGQSSTSAGQSSSSASNASGSANAAAISASAAATSASNAGGSASAANTSAGTAATHASNAGNSAIAAQNSRLSAESTAQSLMPSNFQNIDNWTSDYGGGTGSLASDSRFVVYDHGTYGRVLEVRNSPAFSPHISPKGRIPLVRDKVYRFSTKWFLAGYQTGDVDQHARMHVIGIRGDNSQWNDLNIDCVITPGGAGWGSGWKTDILEFHSNTLMDQGCVWARPLFRLDTQGYFLVQTIEVRDYTGEWNATQSANAAATSYSNAATQASNASGSANAASGSATQAQGFANQASGFAGDANYWSGQSQGHSSTSANQASAASGFAAAAQSSAILAASVSLGSINPNPTFANFPNGTSFPADWIDWSYGGQASRVTGENGVGYSVQEWNSEHQDVGHQQYRPAGLQLIGGAKWFVIEAEVQLISGSLNGSGVHINWDGWTAPVGDVSLSFSSDPDSSGIVRGAGETNRTYRFRKLVQSHASAEYATLYRMTCWEGFQQGRPAKTLKWFRCAIRVAVPSEIRDQTVLAPLQSIVSQQAGVIADVQGRTSAYWNVTAVAGNNRAQIAIVADANSGAGVDIVGDVKINGNLLVTGSVNTGELAENSATGSVSAFTPGDLVWGGGEQEIQSAGMSTLPGKPVFMFNTFGFQWSGGGDFILTAVVRLKRDGVTIHTSTLDAVLNSSEAPYTWQDVASGTYHTYSMTIQVTSNTSYFKTFNRSILLLQTKR